MRQTTDGPPIARAEAHPGFMQIDPRDYHRHSALSRSTLDRIQTSPLHLQHYLVHGADETDAMIEGRVLHTYVEAMVTGRAKTIDERVAVWAGGKRAGIKWEAFKAKNVGRDIVTAKAMKWIKPAAEALLRAPEARRLLEGASIEVAAFWTDEQTGVECRALYDGVRENTLFDLKSTRDLSPAAFGRAAFDYGYHRQNAWYRDGAEAVTGRPFLDFVFIVVEKEPPHAVVLLRHDDDHVALGRAENRANLNLYAACKEADMWPGPSEGTIAMPRWV